jgi:hypothetical protein
MQLIATVCLLLLARGEAYWTCQGNSFDNAMSRCPDLGSQRFSAGGNVSVFVHGATNLKNLDIYPTTSRLSDPFVEFTVGNNIRKSTDYIRDSLNPNWNEHVSLGLLTSGTEVTITIWDYDSGIEFGHDKISRITMRVPFCSTFNASTEIVDCGQPFGCSSDDSLWKMPSRQVCKETGIIDMSSGAECDENSHSCLELTFSIIPFQFDVELINEDVMAVTPVLSAYGPQNKALWTKKLLFGQPFKGILDKFDNVFSYSLRMKGALMMRINFDERYKGAANEEYFYGAVNFPAYIYVCRYNVDNEKGVPSWILKDFSSFNLSVTQMNLEGLNKQFGCFYKHTTGTEKNQWGGVGKNYLTFKTNTISGHDNNDILYYNYPYTILALPKMLVDPSEDVEILYDWAGFVEVGFQQGLICCWFIYLIFRFLWRNNYRVDRVMTWFMSLQYTGEDKRVFASLFAAINRQSPSNIEMRAHIYHAQNLVYFMYTIPFMLLISWGFTLAATVEPQSLGIAVCFLGMSGVLLTLGFRSWEAQKWRMSRLPLVCIGLSTLLFFMFIVSTVFVDPAVINYGAYFDFTALGLVLGAINTVPLILLSFQRDKAYRDSLKILINKMAETLIRMKSDPEKPIVLDPKKPLSVNKALHGLLGDDYTLNPKVPLFSFAGVLNEIAPSKASGMRSGQLLYRTSLVILFVYLMIAIARTEYPSLAFLNCLTLILLDSVHTSISHGDNHWSPGYHIFLLVVGRLLVMGSSGHYWILNYSLCFIVYAWALIQEVINQMLPMLTEEQAGEAVFVGNEVSAKEPNMDMAGTPQFSLGLLMYAFVSILLISAFSQPDELPVTLATVWGAEWHMYVFGLFACCVVITGGLLSACIRSFYLQKHGLLRGWSRASYMLRRSMQLPIVLAVYSEVAIISSGVLIYGASDSNAVLTLAVFVPPIIVCFAYTYKVWLANDYDLIVWPPVDKKSDHIDDSPTDVEVAFNMIENLFGDDGAGPSSNQKPQQEASVGDEKISAKGPGLKTLDNFQLAPLRTNPGQPGGPLDDNVKMPPLPLKSALRKKRELMGIKPASQKQLVVMNEGNPEDSDTFGNSDVFLSANDPWAEFDDPDDEVMEEEEEDKVKKGGQRKGFLQGDTYLKYTKAISESALGQWCSAQAQAMGQFKKDRLKTYQPVGAENMDREGEGGEGNENREGIDAALDEEDPDVNRMISGKADIGRTRSAKDDDGMALEHEAIDGEEEGKSEGRVRGAAAASYEWQEGDDINDMPFKYALIHGYLSSDEYLVLGAWFGGMTLVMIMGCVLGAVVTPVWLGPVVWMAIWMFVCAAVPIIKYFHTYELDETSLAFIYFDIFMHFMFCICIFATVLNGDTGIHGSLWLLDFFFMYPVCIYLGIELYIWIDNGFVIIPLDQDGDGEVTFQEYLEYFKLYPLFVSMFILFVWHLFDWVSFLVGNTAVLLMLVVCFGYVFVRDWAANQFYLSVSLTLIGGIMIDFILFITFMTALFWPKNPIFPLSVFFFTYIFKCCSKIATRLIISDPDTLIFFSPYVMPVFTYDPRKSDIVDETEVAKDFFQAMVVGALWGAFLAIFLYPVSVGVGVACMFLLIIAALISFSISRVPLTLGRYSNLLTHDIIQAAANAAREKFDERKSPLDLNMDGVAETEGAAAKGKGKGPGKPKEKEEFPEGSKVRAVAEARSAKLLGLQIRTKTALDLASELIDDTRALTHVRDDARAYVLDIAEQASEDKTTWFTPYKRYVQSMFKYLSATKGKMKGWVRHSESLLTPSDALAEALITGRGPLGFFGLEGLLYKLFGAAKKHPKLKFLDQPWLAVYDDHANRLNTSQLNEDFDTVGVLRRFRELDDEIDVVAFEEARCGVHFLIMLTLAGQSRLKREQVLVQKFFRENRFRLASNGISPPAEIFSSSSYASIDIPLVAVWLSTLTTDERDRFHSLKVSFSEEQVKRDESVDDEDYQFQLAATDLRKTQRARELEQSLKVRKETQTRQGDRVRALMDFLNPSEKAKFLIKKEEWLRNADVPVFSEDVELYAKFRAAVLQHSDEATDYARAVLSEVESASKNCRIGEYGRNYQFVDPEFPPGDQSLGATSARPRIMNWRCAPGINEQSRLFDEGTDPDDVDTGVFDTDWLLSAISMLAAAGGVGDGGVDEQVANLFIGHYALDGDVTFHTEVGGYCVRLYKNGLWTPIIVDDMFPMLRNEYWSNDNKGIACAHSKECSEIWVSIIEKAFAKYFGSYAAIEKGFVHHALQDLTGCEAECIDLANAGRGPGKRDTWDKIMRFRNNGYLLGAGTGSSALVDKEILDMGIVFNACYVVYDVRSVDGHNLLKLRNPPGNHDEWKGDWSDKSDLWNKRLKKKLNWTDEDDNTFWMSFDDFCNVYRHLYVCRWYDPKKWKTTQFPGYWKRSAKKMEEEAALKEKSRDEVYARNQDGEDKGGFFKDKSKKKKAPVEGEEGEEVKDALVEEMADEDTAGGLPSMLNPYCKLENNPHYQLNINRPTDLRITIAQADSRGVANDVIQPVTLFLLKPLAKRDLMGRLPRTKTFIKDEMVEFTGPPKRDVTMHMYVSLLPGHYILMPACYLGGMEGHFTLTLLSNYTVNLRQIWPVSTAPTDEEESRLMRKQQLIDRNLALMKGAKGHLANLSSKLVKGGDEDEEDPFDIKNIKDDDIEADEPLKRGGGLSSKIDDNDD